MSYQAFESAALAAGAVPTLSEIRRTYGRSVTTASNWRGRFHAAHPKVPDDHPAVTAQSAVMAALAASAEPLTCGQVAQATGLEPETAMHALQNLYEAERLERHTHARPFTYCIPALGRALRLMPRLAGACGPMVASLGTLLSPARPELECAA